MRRYSLLYIALGLLVALWALNFLAIFFYLYWIVWWFDIFMHFMGGFIGGLVAVWFLFDSELLPYKRLPTVLNSILMALVSVMIVGSAWEIFEYLNNITQIFETPYVDTTIDLLADAFGAVLAGYLGSKEVFRIRKYTPTTLETPVSF